VLWGPRLRGPGGPSGRRPATMRTHPGLQHVLVLPQCQGEVPRVCGGWILITWCLARSLAAAVGLAFMRFVGIRCEGPAGVT
jgi:hypothetical protein